MYAQLQDFLISSHVYLVCNKTRLFQKQIRSSTAPFQNFIDCQVLFSQQPGLFLTQSQQAVFLECRTEVPSSVSDVNLASYILVQPDTVSGSRVPLFVEQKLLTTSESTATLGINCSKFYSINHIVNVTFNYAVFSSILLRHLPSPQLLVNVLCFKVKEKIREIFCSDP